VTFNPRTWYPIAAVLSVANVVGVAFASGPVHTSSHAVLAVVFGLWAQRLRQTARKDELKDRFQEELEDPRERLDALEADLSMLRRELNEAQERLDFAERLLAQRPDPHRLGPER
jgi:hypothetical protein